MKKSFVMAAVLTVALALSAAAIAGKRVSSTPDKTYTNSEFKFRLNYPGTWNFEESKSGKVEVDAGYGISIPVGKMAPKMANVKFAENLKEDEEPNINLVVMTYTESRSEKSSKKGDKSDKSKKDKEECVIVEQKAVTWAGQRANLVTTRCPETKKVSIGGKKKKATVWKYMTAVNMKRGQDMYNLMGEMLCTVSGEQLCDDMKDKGKAAEFDRKLKPARDKMVATTKFIK